jgi:hypothetical protein
MKRFMDRADWHAWEAAGKPPLSSKQFVRACRSVSLAFGEPMKGGERYARKILAARDREAGVMALARTAGQDPERVRIMAGDNVDPELKALFVQQLNPEPLTAGTAPLGMDDQRYELHQDAKQLASARCLANPRLDEGEAYALASIEIAERGSSVI